VSAPLPCQKKSFFKGTLPLSLFAQAATSANEAVEKVIFSINKVAIFK
jgi:hypothetical protein